MTSEPPQDLTPQPTTDGANVNSTVASGVSEVCYAARLLLDHAQALIEGQRDHRWIGMKELRRRTALLVHICVGPGEIPTELAMLVGLLLYGSNDLTNTKGSLNEAWLAAIHYEASVLPGPDGNPFPASIRSVAVAAFGREKGDNQRKTIRQWRKEYDYGHLVKLYRLAWLSRAARAQGMLDLEEELFNGMPAPDLTSGLRLTSSPHGERKAFNAHLHDYHLSGNNGRSKTS
jgi:hypothetical protein